MSGIELLAVVIIVFLVIGITAGVILVAVPPRARHHDDRGTPTPAGRSRPRAGEDGKPPRWPGR